MIILMQYNLYLIMTAMILRHSCFVFMFLLVICENRIEAQTKTPAILPGAYQTEEYVPDLQGKQVGICTNQSGLIGKKHLVDTLIELGVNITKVFTPEHGFKGIADAGEAVSYDKKTFSYQLISLYGNHKKPTQEDLEGIDVMLFDIQDVGVRFFTYLSTMTYLMESCARYNIPLVVLDRPNPNGSYVDGPVMETKHMSFLGLHPVPVVHGMTPGEFALMINSEGWLGERLTCNLKVIKVKNWTHNSFYSLPIKPSPNLPDDRSIALYPSLCLFEQTICSVGRGTNKAFQHIGHPAYSDTSYFFIPKSREGAKKPLYENKVCYGINYGTPDISYHFTIQPLINFYKVMNRADFFKPYFHRLAGTRTLEKQIKAGWTEEAIRRSWEPALSQYKKIRLNYLLYP